MIYGNTQMKDKLFIQSSPLPKSPPHSIETKHKMNDIFNGLTRNLSRVSVQTHGRRLPKKAYKKCCSLRRKQWCVKMMHIQPLGQVSCNVHWMWWHRIIYSSIASPRIHLYDYGLWFPGTDYELVKQVLIMNHISNFYLPHFDSLIRLPWTT